MSTAVTRTFEEERQITVGDIECLCDLVVMPRADMEENASRIESVAEDIVEILLPLGLQQGNSDNNQTPECFEERCHRYSLQLREYATELRLSPNLAYHISWALYGIMCLVTTLSICDCRHIDDHARYYEIHLARYSHRLRFPPYFLPGDSSAIFQQISVNFQVLAIRPLDSNCRCHKCCMRETIF